MKTDRLRRKSKELRHAELSRLSRFRRAVDRLEEPVTEAFFHVATRTTPRSVRRVGSKIQLEVPSDGLEILDAPSWVLVENVLMKLRPIFSDSEKEQCSLPRILDILPKHFTLQLPAVDRLRDAWDRTLNAKTVRILKGATIDGLVPGYTATAAAEGIIEVGVDGTALTGREAIELSLYGELQHLDQNKDQKRKSIRSIPTLENGYRVALICLAGQLLSVAREVRDLVAQVFENLSPEERAEHA